VEKRGEERVPCSVFEWFGNARGFYYDFLKLGGKSQASGSVESAKKKNPGLILLSFLSSLYYYGSSPLLYFL
jgi:hypothetical protein